MDFRLSDIIKLYYVDLKSYNARIKEQLSTKLS